MSFSFYGSLDLSKAFFIGELIQDEKIMRHREKRDSRIWKYFFEINAIMASAPIRPRHFDVRNVRFSFRSRTNLGFSTRRFFLSSLTCVARKKATKGG